MVFVFAFDRDDALTISEKRGPVPIEWVRQLAADTDHEIWATGNQRLKKEANLPGTDELIERYTEQWGNPVDHVHARAHPKLERRTGLPPDAPDPDLVTAVYLHAGHPAPRGFQTGTKLTREQRLRLLAALFPDADGYFVIDNKHLGHLPQWTHLYPDAFADLVLALDSLSAGAKPEPVKIPDYYDWPPNE